MATLDIGDVVARTGVPASTLRYYEARSLIGSVGRVGGRRQFDASVIDTLALIALGRAAGFSLDEIASMLTPDGGADIDRVALSRRADEIDATVHRLRAVSETLHHAAHCPADNHLDCPAFRELLDGASAGRYEPL